MSAPQYVQDALNEYVNAAVIHDDNQLSINAYEAYARIPERYHKSYERPTAQRLADCEWIKRVTADSAEYVGVCLDNLRDAFRVEAEQENAR